MTPKNLTLIATLLIFAGLSLWLKASWVAPSEDPVGDWEKLRAMMSEAGFHVVSEHELVADTDFKAVIFSEKECQGGIAMVPLYRNAEGAKLLGEVEGIEGTDKVEGFWFRGKRYDEFPVLDNWFVRLPPPLGNPFKEGDLRGVVKTVEMGGCGYADALPWGSLWAD